MDAPPFLQISTDQKHVRLDRTDFKLQNDAPRDGGANAGFLRSNNHHSERRGLGPFADFLQEHCARTPDLQMPSSSGMDYLGNQHRYDIDFLQHEPICAPEGNRSA